MDNVTGGMETSHQTYDDKLTAVESDLKKLGDQTEKKAISTNSELSTFRSDILDLRQQLREITEKTSKNKDTLEKLQVSGDVLVDRQSQLKETLENNTLLVTTVNKTLQACNGYVTNLQQDTSMLQGNLQSQMYSHNVVIMNLNNLNLTQAQQRNLITTLQRSVDDTSQAIQRIKNDFQNLQQVFLQAKKDTDWLKEKVQSLQTLAANNSALAKANNDTLEDMNSQLNSFTGQMDNITTASQANEQNLKDLQDVHKDAENRMAIKFSQLEERFQLFETDIVNIISNLSYTAHHLRTLTSNLNEVRTTCTDMLTKHTGDLTSLNNTLANTRLDSLSLRVQQDMMRLRLDTCLWTESFCGFPEA
ncbi:PREDICTED: collectin-12-like [Ceratotherium simum simum]|uniref:Collectin-12-like n=1 Tax=Ceratotherium simum simum TaxID=73337 RepID=A0ABM1C774_CERSS|nr:PREDICTED: collectin-12-like [Ceratotherium simum simum]